MNDNLIKKAKIMKIKSSHTLKGKNKKHDLLPLIILILTIFIDFTSKYFFAEEAHLFSTLKSIIAICFALIGIPYLVDASGSFLVSSWLFWLGTKHCIGRAFAFGGAGLLFFILLGGIVAASFKSVGTRAPLKLMPQLNWPFYAERRIAANGGTVKSEIYSSYKGKNRVIKISFDTRTKNSYAGWMVAFPDVSFLQNWTKDPYISFLIRSENVDVSHILLGLKDINGYEIKTELIKLITKNSQIDSTNWHSVEIEVNEFASKFGRPLDWHHVDNISFTLGHIDPDLSKNQVSFYISELIFWNNE